jgi:hypothetical protein
MSEFNETWIFSIDIWGGGEAQVSNFIKIRPVRTELFHAGGWTEERKNMMKLIVVFRSLANAPKYSS